MAKHIGESNRPFYAEVTFGYYQDDDQWIEKQKSIICFARDFSEAMADIEQYYGDELVSVEKLSIYEESDIIELSLDTGRAIEKELEDV